ncbi:MAG: hypothetical protein QNJ57_07280 [Flavobacteriaceae bacterium]|nr:hypothetical protein [Flavobacteriaceae bacterium]
MLKKRIILFLIVALSWSLSAVAQPCPPSNPGGPCQPPGKPIDGALGILLVVGAAYGIKKLRENNE